MSIIEEFVTKYMAENGEDKKYTRTDVKKVCSDFVTYFSYVIEESARNAAKENSKSNGKKTSKTSEKNLAFSLNGIGKFSVVEKAPRKLNLPTKSSGGTQAAQFTEKHLALQFKPSSTIKEKLKAIKID
jgi:nucleoid DNA-binding protein